MTKIFNHTVQSWQAYPRIYYFNNRLDDFLPRFKSILGPYSEILKDAGDLIQELEELKSIFKQPPEIIIIGDEDLPHDDLVVAKVDQKEDDSFDKHRVTTETSGSRITIVICHAEVTYLDKTAFQVLKSRFDLLKGLPNRRKKILLVVCSLSRTFNTDERNAFNDKLEEFVNVSCDRYPDRHCFVKTQDKDPAISKQISNALELLVINGFNNARTLLTDYKNISKHHVSSSAPLLDNHGVVEQLTSLYERSVDKIGTFHQILARVLRCALIKPLSENHCLRPRVCNTTLMAKCFEESVVKALSDGTVIKALSDGTVIQDTTALIKAPSLNIFKEKVKVIVASTEKDVTTFARVLHKLAFEINGYLKKSNVLKVSEATKRHIFDKRTMEEILKLTNVCGAGTVYGEFEIHIDKDDRVDQVKHEVAAIFSERKIPVSFRVKVIEKRATELADNIVHGDLITIQDPNMSRPRTGTLAGFVQGRADRKLYGLTCGHVAPKNTTVYLNRNEPFATCISSIIDGFIDIALLQVSDDVYDRCEIRFRDERGQWKKGQLFRVALPCDIEGETVFKYGAISKFTRGIVCSDDFKSDFGDYGNCILLIDRQTGTSIPPFAEPGDSGSMVCVANIENTKAVDAVALLSHGELKLKGDENEIPYFVCSLLNIGLEKLESDTRQQFSFL